MAVQHRHRVTVLAALGAVLLGGCSFAGEPSDTPGIPTALPAPDPHGAYASEDAVRAVQLRQWTAVNGAGGRTAAAVTHIQAVQVVESGDEHLVYLHTDLPHTDDGGPPEQIADLLAVYEAWPNRPAMAVRIGAFDADGHRVGTAGIPAPTPPSD
ncbi:hypothetical protein OG625_04525 [Streptomyces sp. NBC_01351]|uniref:hypothetical protein n=1 Tax=Streptomyces sp. NBC_01351 TaxID=2903833 RepID=UPI002E348A05|nr:hypothetical protein [Streptomyces sp. NBC_01351]